MMLAVKRKPNPLRRDPTRLAGTRRALQAEAKRRFARLKAELAAALESPEWQALPLQAALERLQGFLAEAVGRLILAGDWWAGAVADAYERGVRRAYDDAEKPALREPVGFLSAREQFVRQVLWRNQQPAGAIRLNAARDVLGRFMSPQVAALSARLRTELKGATDAMAQRIARELSEGFARRESPRQVAQRITAAVDSVGRARALLIATTELTRAHGEAQLDAMEALGAYAVGAVVEWDALEGGACPACAALDGVVLTVEQARGLIPRHPRCRCAWRLVSRRREEGQQRTRREVQRAVRRSLREGSGEWRGAEMAANWGPLANHLPGQHDQKSHGRGGGSSMTASLADGRQVRFVSHPKQRPDETTVLLDPRKLDTSWRAGSPGEYIPPGGGGAEIGGRRADFLRFLDKGEPIQASRGNLWPPDGGQFDFQDGRHRFSVLRDLGAGAVAVTIPRDQAREIVARFGADMAANWEAGWLPIEVVNHLPGKHDQKSHGRLKRGPRGEVRQLTRDELAGMSAGDLEEYRQEEDEAVESSREREEEAVSRARDKEDEEREAHRARVDEQAQARREQEDEEINERRNAEDEDASVAQISRRQAQREREDAAREQLYERLERVIEREREREDARIERERTAQDRQRQERYDRQDAERQRRREAEDEIWLQLQFADED